jgi:hypothetical protein
MILIWMQVIVVSMVAVIRGLVVTSKSPFVYKLRMMKQDRLCFSKYDNKLVIAQMQTALDVQWIFLNIPGIM